MSFLLGCCTTSRTSEKESGGSNGAPLSPQRNSGGFLSGLPFVGGGGGGGQQQQQQYASVGGGADSMISTFRGSTGQQSAQSGAISGFVPGALVGMGTAPPPDTQALAERMREAGARLQSFKEWPYARSLMPLCTPERLSGCGFYYDPDPEFEDRVSCAFCHLSLGGWDRNHDPVKEHQKISPRCPFLVQFGMPNTFVPMATFKTELVGTTWRVEDYIDDEVHVRTDGMHQSVLIRTCASRTSRMVVLVQGPVKNVTIDECQRIRVTILGAVGHVTVRMCEEVEVTVQEGKPPPNFTVDRTNGCRLELSPGAVGGECLTSQSSAVLLVSALGVTIIKPPVGPGKKAANDHVVTRWLDGHFSTTPISAEDLGDFTFASEHAPAK